MSGYHTFQFGCFSGCRNTKPHPLAPDLDVNLYLAFLKDRHYCGFETAKNLLSREGLMLHYLLSMPNGNAYKKIASPLLVCSIEREFINFNRERV